MLDGYPVAPRRYIRHQLFLPVSPIGSGATVVPESRFPEAESRHIRLYRTFGARQPLASDTPSPEVGRCLSRHLRTGRAEESIFGNDATEGVIEEFGLESLDSRPAV
jgi:hypothetical protein